MFCSGGQQSKADRCVYEQEEGGNVCVILVVYVDNILIGGEAKRVEKVCDILSKRFPTNKLDEVQWYLGVPQRGLGREVQFHGREPDDLYRHRAEPL
ncbi:unnamed protein product [Sphacelaria rigidula]